MSPQINYEKIATQTVLSDSTIILFCYITRFNCRITYSKNITELLQIYHQVCSDL
jgi:hypothetical protein